MQAATGNPTPGEEYARFDAARTKAQEQLGALYDKALDEVGEDNAAIFEIHQMMLDDDDYLDAVKGILDTQGATAEYAVSTTGENLPPPPPASPPWRTSTCGPGPPM